MLKDTIKTNFLRIGLSISQNFDFVNIELFNASEIDEASLIFFKTIANYSNLSITLNYQKTYISQTLHLEREEVEILNFINNRIISDSEILIKYALRLICCGNSWTARRILIQSLNKGIKSPKIYTLLARSYISLEDSFSAEYYCNLAIASNNSYYQIINYYSLAMLYLRNHPNYLKDIEKAEKYLNTAYYIIDSAESLDDKMFHKIFNRNGYALILFRKKEYKAAINVLKWGILQLEKSEKIRDVMHKSVLKFNLAQCYQARGDHESSIEAYLDLIDLDPKDVDYRIKLAHIYIQNNKIEEAIDQLEYAKSLNAAISEVYILIEICLSIKKAPISEKIKLLSVVYEISPNNYDNLYNLCSLLLENDNPEICLEYLEDIDLIGINEDLVADFYALKAEALLALDNKNTAIRLLEKGIEEYPNCQNLIDNLDLVIKFNQ